MDDALIIERILAGNKNEYALLMDKYYKELFKYIYNICDQYETTEDLLQEIFLKVYQKLNSFNPDKASFRTWIYRISHHHTINYLKKKSNQVHLYSQEYDDNFTKANIDVEESAVKNSEVNRILKAMEKVLKEKHYQIMALHYFSDLSVKDVSLVTKIPLKTVYKAIESSIKKIKKELGEL